MALEPMLILNRICHAAVNPHQVWIHKGGEPRINHCSLLELTNKTCSLKIQEEKDNEE